MCGLNKAMYSPRKLDNSVIPIVWEFIKYSVSRKAPKIAVAMSDVVLDIITLILFRIGHTSKFSMVHSPNQLQWVSKGIKLTKN